MKKKGWLWKVPREREESQLNSPLGQFLSISSHLLGCPELSLPRGQPAGSTRVCRNIHKCSEELGKYFFSVFGPDCVYLTDK